ncbi:MAG TPA: ribonuclease Y [Erysipelotrichaceae bacterium]|nr:ribonuclease Y [Erysipelotrichaceae bacterium]
MLILTSVFLTTNLPIIVVIAIGVGAFIIGIVTMLLVPYVRNNIAKNKVKKIIREAEIKADHIIKNAQIDGKQTVNELKNEANKEIRERKLEIQNFEKSLQQREQSISRRDNILISKENALDEKNETLNRRLKELDRKESALQEKIDSIIGELEKVAQMSTQEAKDELFARVEAKLSKEIASYIKTKEEEAKEECDEKAKELLGYALTRYAQDVTTERAVSVVALPSDEMKGRIIGREGRNIRSLEQLLGVDLIIDDTPEVITISCFNPVRREIARLSLESLIKDGRIQPGRIEEIVEKTKKDVEDTIYKTGQEAAFKLGLPRINKELLNYVGRLKYRTSYGQNALNHSMEVAYLCGVMAAELGLDQNLAKRAGLLHDIGKAADFEMDGSHVEIGARLAKKFGEGEIVINSIESHHDDVPAKSIIANLVQAADTLSAARPGARSEMLENYIKRIEQLEEICSSYDGVYQSYAMQSGRELRVMVIPDKIDDVGAYKLAKDIKERIEGEMTYPGQIKVSVIREYRAIETAK